MKVRPFFIYLIIAFALSVAVFVHFYHNVDSAYWVRMKELKLVKSNEAQQAYFDGELEPVFPDDKENSSDYFGVDSNKNGVRDDVEIWINRNFQTRNERMAYKQYQRIINQGYVIEKDTKYYLESLERADKFSNKLHDSFLCISQIENALKQQHKKKEYDNTQKNVEIIKELTFNSPFRRSSYNSFVHRIHGSYESNNDCNFKIDKYN
jgi:hypothetical protein